MSGSVGGDTAEPNLTPILDMVFQLITFFMLVTNFKAKEIDQTLTLPVVGSAKPVDVTKSPGGLLVLNIDKNGVLKHFNAIKNNVEQFIGAEANAVRIANGLSKEDELPVTVVIRADQDTPYGKMNKVIKACQDRGYRKFALMAADKPKEVRAPKK